MIIDISNFKKGIAIELDGQLYQVLDYQHIKMGRGSAQIRLKLRDIRGGHITEKSFQASEKFKVALLEKHAVQYLYCDKDFYYFMDTGTYDQITLDKSKLDAATDYLKEGLNLEVSVYQDETIGVELPVTVELKVTETGPSFKGNTASGGSKPATLETGIIVQVPFFINVDDAVKVDTRSGSYIERVAR